MKSSNVYVIAVVVSILSYPIYKYSNKEIDTRREKAAIERKIEREKAMIEAQSMNENRMRVYTVMTPLTSNTTIVSK